MLYTDVIIDILVEDQLITNKERFLMTINTVSDNGGRRFNGERRKASGPAHLPERRSGEDRRNGFDRRRNRYKNTGDVDRRQITDML